MADGPMADLVGRKLGDFILCEQIGEGGYAVVYRCEQPQLGRNAVVKVLHERVMRNDAALDRFHREAQLASQLDHPYAAHVYASGDEEDGLFWIAMELVHGTALDKWLQAHGPMPLAQFVLFFKHVAEVVHAAHKLGIIHRDLKPSNIMVIEHDGGLLPKLLDFGIAKLIGKAAPVLPERASEAGAATIAPLHATGPRAPCTRTDSEAADKGHQLTRSGARLGSMAYMAPERWTDPQAVGPAADLYALGILAYEVLTGRKPFTAESTHEYYHHHVHGEVPSLGDAFPPEVDRHAARRARGRRALAAAAVALALGAVWYQGRLQRELVEQQASAARQLAEQQARTAQQLTEATITQSELEQGRAALLHNEPEALPHLAEAYRRDPSPSTAFMLARAIQPRLAEQARFPSSFGRMWSATFSPDGQQIVTTDEDLGRHEREARPRAAARRCEVALLHRRAVSRRQAGGRDRHPG